MHISLMLTGCDSCPGLVYFCYGGFLVGAHEVLQGLIEGLRVVFLMTYLKDSIVAKTVLIIFTCLSMKPLDLVSIRGMM